MNKVVVVCLIFVSLCVGIGFIYSQCVLIPKELRGGIYLRLAEITLSQEENKQEIDKVQKKINDFKSEIEQKIPCENVYIDNSYVKCANNLYESLEQMPRCKLKKYIQSLDRYECIN